MAVKATDKRISIIDRLINNIKMGDKVIWIITLLLIVLSLVCIFSSTSLMAMKMNVSRTTIFLGQFKFVVAGLLILVALSSIPSLKLFRALARIGFIGSLILLILLDAKVNLGRHFHTVTLNGATRTISVFGFGLQVYEVVKVAMVMYLAWALQAYESGKFFMANLLGTRLPEIFGWLKDARAQRWVYIFIPMLMVMGLIIPGSTGSALMIGIVMFATVMLGGLKWKDLFGPAVAAIAVLALLVMVHIVSNGQMIHRLQTAFNRVRVELPYPSQQAREAQREAIAAKTPDPATLKEGTQEFKNWIDEIRQPMGAEIAIVQGGRRIVGKGPGKSTQKYVVPVMFEDYMFSFIVEEYGLLVGIVVILMFMSLFARGAIIVHSCNNRFAKACVGGLVFLTTFQGLFHILINCNIGILTGQTLPFISHGRCSFLCFSIAMGVVLSISKMANKKIQDQQKAEERLLEKDEIEMSLDIVEDIDNMLEQQ